MRLFAILFFGGVTVVGPGVAVAACSSSDEVLSSPNDASTENAQSGGREAGPEGDGAGNRADVAADVSRPPDSTTPSDGMTRGDSSDSDAAADGVGGPCTSNADCVDPGFPDSCNICASPLNYRVCTSSGACACACDATDGGSLDAESAGADGATADGGPNDAQGSGGDAAGDGAASCHTNTDCVSTLPDTCSICATPLNHFVCTSASVCECACKVPDGG